MKGKLGIIFGLSIGLSSIFYLTNPKKSSFYPFLDEWITSEISENMKKQKGNNFINRFQNFIKDSVSVLQNRFTEPIFYNLLLFTIVKTVTRGENYIFIGFLNKWFPLSKIDNEILDSLQNKNE